MLEKGGAGKGKIQLHCMPIAGERKFPCLLVWGNSSIKNLKGGRRDVFYLGKAGSEGGMFDGRYRGGKIRYGERRKGG